jgi:hypothetical protein
MDFLLEKHANLQQMKVGANSQAITGWWLSHPSEKY